MTRISNRGYPLTVRRVGLVLGCLLAFDGCAHRPQAPIATASVIGPTAAIDAPADLVTVIPFDPRSDAFIYLPVTVDGYHGTFLLDTGAPVIALNGAHFRARSDGGLDTVRTAADTATEVHPLNVHTVQIGTLQVTMRDNGGGPLGPKIRHNASVHPSERWDDAPWSAGDLGLSVLDAVECILDYPHRRVVLIKLDSAGHRLAAVPEYTPSVVVPLIPLAQWWGLLGTIHGVRDTIALDTGNPNNELGAQFGNKTLVAKWDLLAGGHTFNATIFARMGGTDYTTLGAQFFYQQGVVGFNHRTKQLLLY